MTHSKVAITGLFVVLTLSAFVQACGAVGAGQQRASSTPVVSTSPAQR